MEKGIPKNTYETAKLSQKRFRLKITIQMIPNKLCGVTFKSGPLGSKLRLTEGKLTWLETHKERSTQAKWHR